MKNIYKKIKNRRASPIKENCSISVSNDIINFLYSLPDVGEADMKKRCNLIKKAKKGLKVRGVDIEAKLNWK